MGWGPKFESYVESWAAGVRNTARKDLLSPEAVSSVVNGEMIFSGDGTAVIGKRKGSKVLARMTSTADEMRGVVWFDRINELGVESSHILTIHRQKFMHYDPVSGVVTNPGNTGFTAPVLDPVVVDNGPEFPSTAIANNLLFIAGYNSTGPVGDDIGGPSPNVHPHVFFDGTTFRTVGMQAPEHTTGSLITYMSAAPGAAGSMTGDYDIGMTYYNPTFGVESSMSGPDYLTVTVTSETIDVTAVGNFPLTDISPKLATHVRIYLRKRTISTQFYRVAELALTSTTSINLDISDDEYNALTQIGPDRFENNPPPPSIYLFTWHNNRMFGADSGVLYYSKIGAPMAWDPENYEEIFPEDGEAITGIFPFNGNLIVLKENSVCAVIGDGPSTWSLRKLYSGGVGCVARGSIVLAGGLAYWWGPDGPIAWDGVSEPARIGKAAVSETLGPTGFNAAQRGRIRGVHDVDGERILWAYPLTGSAHNTGILSYKIRAGAFEGSWWGQEFAALASARSTTGRMRILAGMRTGVLVELGAGAVDAWMPGRKITDTVTVTSGNATITTTGLETAVGFSGVWAVLFDPTTQEPLFYGQVASNTATSFTLAVPPSFSGTYRYVLGGIPLAVETPWTDDGAPFHKKRYEFGFFQVETDGISPWWMQVQFDWDGGERRSMGFTLESGAVERIGRWDVGLWDVAHWAGLIPIYQRWRMARTGRTWRMRIVHVDPFVEARIFKVGMGGEYLTTKR